MTTRHLLGTATSLAILFALAMPVVAEEGTRAHPRAVVELFTSQGCAQCPPADALLTSLADDQDVIALAYHVNYWDYIGWADTFGDEENADRQRAYAKSWGSSRIYTPQMVVNGSTGVIGSRRNEVHGAIDNARLDLPVEMVVTDTMLKINIPPMPDMDDAVIWLVTYLDRADVAIERGENAGKTMAYTQVVTDRQVLGMWEASTGAHLKLPLDEVMAGDTDGVAVLVQQEREGLPGLIIGAAAVEN